MPKWSSRLYVQSPFFAHLNVSNCSYCHNSCTPRQTRSCSTAQCSSKSHFRTVWILQMNLQIFPFEWIAYYWRLDFPKGNRQQLWKWLEISWLLSTHYWCRQRCLKRVCQQSRTFETHSQWSISTSNHQCVHLCFPTLVWLWVSKFRCMQKPPKNGANYRVRPKVIITVFQLAMAKVHSMVSSIFDSFEALQS